MHQTASTTDRELLIAYRQSRSPDLFAQLVARHVDLVYSVACRHVNEPNLAQDVTQEVFLALFRKIRVINPNKPLVPWLFTTTRLVALQTLRADARRRRREREVAIMHDSLATPDETWSLIRRDIDDAVAHLAPQERDAVLLRYFAGKSHQEIASDLAISEDASKKRLQRALESLRDLLTTRGLAVPSVALAAALTTHAAAKAAPAAIAAAIAAQTTLQSATGTTVSSILKGILMVTAKVKIAIAACAVIVAIPVCVVVVHYAAAPSAPPPPVSAMPDSPMENPDVDLAEFQRIYKLDPGQVIARIAPPFPASRTLGYEMINRGRMSGQDRAGNTTPSTMVIDSADGELSIRSGIWGGSRTGLLILRDCLSLGSESVEGDSNLINTPLPGDWIIRKGASEDRICQALEKLFSDELGVHVALQFREVTRPAYVFHGTWSYKRLDFADSRQPLRSGSPEPLVALYAGDVFDAAAPQQGSGTSYGRGLASIIGGYVRQLTVIEGDGLPETIPWRYYGTRDGSPNAQQTARDSKSILNHVTEQTGLTWSEETRTVRRLFVQATPAALPKPYVLADGEHFKYIMDPPPEARDILWKRLDTALSGANTRATPASTSAVPASISLVVNLGQPQRWTWSERRPSTLSAVLEYFLNAYPQTVEGDSTGLPIPGDFLARDDATPEQLRADLEKILRTELQQSVTLTFRDVPRKVIALSGDWKFTPADSNRARDSLARSVPSLELYQSKIVSRPEGFSIGDSRRFADELGKSLNKQILIDAKDLPKDVVWAYNDSTQHRFDDPAAVLNNLKAQTGLTWSEETRTVRRLFIEPAK